MVTWSCFLRCLNRYQSEKEGEDAYQCFLVFFRPFSLSIQVSLSPTLFARIILEQFATDKELVPPSTGINISHASWCDACHEFSLGKFCPTVQLR